MSYDIFLSDAHDFDWNYTYNVQPMTARAGLHSLYDLDGMTSREVLARVDTLIASMEAEPEVYRALNPRNGWGDYDGFLSRLKVLRDALAENPSSLVKVC